MEEISIGVFNQNLEMIGVIDVITTLQIVINLNTASTINLVVVLTEENVKLLKSDNYLILNTENKERANAFIIEYTNINLNTDGTIILQVQGRNLLSILNRRVITQNYNFTNININTGISNMISNECINASNTDRNIPNLIYVGTESNALISYSNTELYTNLLDAISSCLALAELGINIYLNLNTKQFEIVVFNGVDRTLTQNANDPIILATELNNIMSQNFIHSTKDYVNVAFVYGTIGDSNTEEVVIVNNNAYSGLNRYEQSVETDIESLTEENYSSSFTNVGELFIKNKDLYKCFSANFNIRSDIKYDVDFKIGDYITCISKEWSIREDLQITQTTQSWSNKGYTLVFQLGKPLPTLTQKLNERSK